MTEVEWQAQVVDLAHFLGWRHLHVRRTIGKGKKWVTSTNRKGWPDLFLWHPRRGGFVALELKVRPNDATDEQREVLDELAAAGAGTMVAFPEDLDAVRALLQPWSLPRSRERGSVPMQDPPPPTPPEEPT